MMMNFQRFTFVEPVLFGYMFSIYTLIPAQQQLVYRKVCLHKWNETYCDILDVNKTEIYHDDQSYVQQTSATWLQYISLAVALPAILPAVLFGSWSDKLGRKSVLWLPLVGDFIQYLGLTLNAYYMSASIVHIIIVIAITSLFGGFASVLSSTFSYVADISGKESRTKRVVILESMTYLSGVFASLISGYLIKYLGFVALFSTVTIILGLVLIYALFLKESYQPQQKATWSDLVSLKYLKDAVSVYTKRRAERCRSTLLLLLLVFIFVVAMFVGFSSAIVLYAKHTPRNFQPDQIGYLLTEFNACKFVGAVTLMALFSRYLKWTDYSVMILGILSYTGLNIFISLGNTPAKFYLACLWSIGNGLSMPFVRSAMSKMVSADEKGKMFSVAASLEVFAQLVMGLISFKIYKKTEPIDPAFFFYVMAAVTSIPLLLVIYMKFRGQSTPYEALVEPVDVQDVSSQVAE